MYAWPPIPGVQALFDPKAILSDAASLVSTSNRDAGCAEVVVTGSFHLHGELYPVEFRLAPDRGFAVSRFSSGDLEGRVTECLEVIDGTLWVPAATVFAERAYWQSVDQGFSTGTPSTEVRIAVDEYGTAEFSLAPDAVPDQLLSILPPGTAVSNAINGTEMVAGARAPSEDSVIALASNIEALGDRELRPLRGVAAWLALGVGLALTAFGCTFWARRP